MSIVSRKHIEDRRSLSYYKLRGLIKLIMGLPQNQFTVSLTDNEIQTT